jgi:hypothetical protein
MSGRANPDRMERFLGAAFVAVGALIFALCGLCTLSFAGTTISSAFRYHGPAGGIANGLALYGIVGGVPTFGGFMLMRYGWRMYRGPPSSPPSDATKSFDA